jgi:hypothetical protein
MSKDLKFEDIKEEVRGLTEDILKSHLDGEYVESDQKQKLSETLNEINQKLHQTYPGYKFIVSGTSFKKGQSGLNYASSCFWNPNADGSVMVRYENEFQNAFVTVAGVTG